MSDDAMVTLGLVLWVLSVVAAIVLLSSCYDAHAAAPCADGGVPESGLSGSVANRVHSLGAAGSNPAPSTTYPGPCPFAYDHFHCWCVDATHEVCGAPCAGPIVASECYANLEDWLSR